MGSPLVALHGVYGSGRRFADSAGRLGGKVIAPDLRGHGRSLPDPPWHVEQHVADVLATVDDVQEFDLLGYSFGGAVAAHLAALAPQRVRRLLLLDPALGLAPDFVLPKARGALKRDVFDSPADAERHLAGTAPWLDSTEVEERITDSLVRGDDGRWRWRTEDAAVVTAFSEACRDINAPPDGVPVLLVRAELNPRGSERLAAAWSDFPQVRIATVNCDHHLLGICAAPVAALITEFRGDGPAQG